MINKDKLKTILADYKKDFLPTQWKDQKYKWQAVKHFQDHWDINAPDFRQMFITATEKAAALLASMNYFPREMIKSFASEDPEAVRAMFISLFDESRVLTDRVSKFQSDAEELKNKYNSSSRKQHFQNPTAISTYLWLRRPDKYYIYKYTECRAAALELESDFVPKKGAALANMLGAIELYNEITVELGSDGELIGLLQSVLDDSCYPDTKFRTLTMDVCYYIAHSYAKKRNGNDSAWYYEDYSPGITADQWLELLNNESIFTPGSLEIMKRIKDYGGMATCTQLSEEYGDSPGSYNLGSSSLAKRIVQATGCPTAVTETGEKKYWPVLYKGKPADKDESGCFVWKLREELKEALNMYDFSNVNLYAQPDSDQTDRNYWWLNANPNIWSFSEIGVGETQGYTLFNENGNKRRVFQNFLDAKAGDLVIGYESYPVKQVVALAKITQENDGEKLYFEKTESLSFPIDYKTLKGCRELENMEYFGNPQGSLFKLSRGEYNFILDMIRETNPISANVFYEPYSKEKFLEEVYMSEEGYNTLESLLDHRKNLILQGAPGVGKTFAAKRLAYAILGKKDDSHVEYIQFHQNYSYEDFIMGYRPKEGGFELQHGIFYRFCRKAENHPNEPFFFIIDEINRGNMSKIFGELLMLIEKEYRGTKVTMAYNKQQFTVPPNLYLIGMMNTADRSIAIIDYALRRRFSFYEMEPGFGSDGFKKYQAGLNNDTLDTLLDRCRELNEEIASDASLGKGFCIGHSYFCGQTECTEEWLQEVAEYDILPMLSEYWFDEPEKLVRWENKLRGVFND